MDENRELQDKNIRLQCIKSGLWKEIYLLEGYRDQTNQFYTDQIDHLRDLSHIVDREMNDETI